MGLENFLNDRITEEDTYKYTLVDILKTRALHTPDLTAYIFLRDGEEDEEKVTYRELDQAAASLADKFMEMGLKGERALMLFPTGMDFIKALFGCFYAGVIAVPAYPPRKNRSLDRLRLQVIDSGASIILTNGEIFKNFERSFSDVTELKQLKWIATDLHLLPKSQIQSPNRQIAKSPNRPIAKPPNPEDIALLQYTSGSTGQPKGVMVTHRNIVCNVEYIRQSFELSRKSVSVTWLPSFHDMGLIDGVIEPVYTGFPGVFMNPVHFLQKPSRWLKAITKYKGTHGGGPNFAFDFCVDEVSDEEKEGIDLSSMHTLYCGAEPIYKETFERFIKTYEHLGFSPKALYPCYGMAETTLIITGPPAGQGYNYLAISDKEFSKNRITPVTKLDKDTKYIVGVGFPWIDTIVRIVNPDTCRPCCDNEIGEVWVKGSIVTAGYWNNKEETISKFGAVMEDEPGDRYLRTGDLGFFNNGELYISGRLKDLIIIHGRNIYPQDLERLTEVSHPALRANACAAFSVDVDREEKLIIVAEVERSAMRNLNVEELCENIRMKIAEEKELSVYGIQLLRTASILKTSSGKIQRKACRQAFLERSLEVIGESFIGQHHNAGSEPVMEDGLVNMQAWLMTWIQLNLNIPLEQIDLSRPISTYGANFPQIIRLQHDFLERFNIELSPFQFLEHIPINELCVNALNLKTGK